MNTQRIIFTYLFLVLSFASCQKEESNSLHYTNGYIIGFDPCSINHHYKIGYVIISDDLKDTLITYNLSDNKFIMPASILLRANDTLYKIPEIAFQRYRDSPFFPNSLRYKYPVKISYTIATESEKIYYECTTDLLFLNFQQIIVKSGTK